MYPIKSHGTGIFTHICHENQPNVDKYTSPMDPMSMLYFSIHHMTRVNPSKTSRSLAICKWLTNAKSMCADLGTPGGQTVMIKSYIRDLVLVQMLQQRIPPKILFLQWQRIVNLVSALYTNVVDHVDLMYDIHHALASNKKQNRQPPSLSPQPFDFWGAV